MTTTAAPTARIPAPRRAEQLPAPRHRAELIAVLPAHDEAATISHAIDSLRAQDPAPTRIVVVPDNCTDATAELAGAAGAEVLPTHGNTRMKAGALNQALRVLLPQLADDDLVLVMDADSALHPGFLATAVTHLRADPRLGGVGGTFCGGPGGGLVGTFQRNEYARYARDVRRLRGRALVLTGTASVFRAGTLRAVAAARAAGHLPDRSGRGEVYDTHVLTEDNELTLALLHLGHRILTPAGCTLETEVMTTWAALGRQRLRWKRGALENLVDYGWTPVTRRYWGRQALSALGVLATMLYLASIAVGLVVGLHLHVFWLAVTAVFAVERVVTVRARGPRQMLLAAPVVIEMTYDVYLQIIQARAFLAAALRRRKDW